MLVCNDTFCCHFSRHLDIGTKFIFVIINICSLSKQNNVVGFTTYCIQRVLAQNLFYFFPYITTQEIMKSLLQYILFSPEYAQFIRKCITLQIQCRQHTMHQKPIFCICNCNRSSSS